MESGFKNITNDLKSLPIKPGGYKQDEGANLVDSGVMSHSEANFETHLLIYRCLITG